MKILETPAVLALLCGLLTSAASAPASMAAEENPEAQAGRQFLAESCDTNVDSYISAEEARTCAEQHYGAAGGGQATMTREQFGTVFPGADNAPELFKQVDEDGDGQITLAEWVKWHEQGFTAATKASEGRMPAADYESMDWDKGAYVRPSQGG
jgi:hypothetical protein